MSRNLSETFWEIEYVFAINVLFLFPGSSDPNKPSWGWWVGRTNLNMRYWGGSSPGSGKCACALKNECRNDNPTCNCDAGLSEDGVSDDGYVVNVFGAKWHGSK